MLMQLKELRKLCRELGLISAQTPEGGKKFYVDLLRQYYMPKGGLDYTEVNPMSCFPYWNLKEEEQQEVWNSTDWWAQEKLDGCRIMLHLVRGKGVFAHTRTVSRKTFRYNEVTGNLLIKDVVPECSMVLDCEAMVEVPITTKGYTTSREGGVKTETTLHSTTAVLALEEDMSLKLQVDQNAPIKFKVLDICAYDGRDMRDLTLSERDELLYEALKEIPESIKRYLEKPVYVKEGKKKYMEQVVKEGGEGVVLKYSKSPYTKNDSRPRRGWVKVKKRLEFDAFVSGFVRGDADKEWKDMVGALEFSVYVGGGKKHVIAACSAVPLEQRVLMSEYDSVRDEVKLKPDWYGRVAQVSGLAISSRLKRLSHATIDKWREGADGKKAEDCVEEMENLEKLARWES